LFGVGDGHAIDKLSKKIGRPLADQEKMGCLKKNRNQEQIKKSIH
jgi:hypothetical protein